MLTTIGLGEPAADHWNSMCELPTHSKREQYDGHARYDDWNDGHGDRSQDS